MKSKVIKIMATMDASKRVASSSSTLLTTPLLGISTPTPGCAQGHVVSPSAYNATRVVLGPTFGSIGRVRGHVGGEDSRGWTFGGRKRGMYWNGARMDNSCTLINGGLYRCMKRVYLGSIMAEGPVQRAPGEAVAAGRHQRVKGREIQ